MVIPTTCVKILCNIRQTIMLIGCLCPSNNLLDFQNRLGQGAFFQLNMFNKSADLKLNTIDIV